jgi:hypothetical protein
MATSSAYDLAAPHDMAPLAAETFRAFDATVTERGRLFRKMRLNKFDVAAACANPVALPIAQGRN